MTLDQTVLHGIHAALTGPFLDFLMPKITALGNGGAIWLLAAGCLLCTKKYRRQGVLLLGGLAVGVLVGNVALKNLIARPRPCWGESVPLLIASPTDYSFPSGHTLSSAIGATILTKTDMPPSPWRRSSPSPGSTSMSTGPATSWPAPSWAS